MSETTEEPTPDENEPEETPEPIEGDDTDLEEAEEEEQTPAEAADTEGSAEIAKKLQQATQAYHTRIKNLLGQEMEQMVCPKCDGFGFSTEPLLITDEYKVDETKERCPVCDGMGQLVSGARNPQTALVACTTCGSMGYVAKSLPAPPNVTQFPTAPAQTPANGAVQFGYTDANGQFIPFVTPQTG